MGSADIPVGVSAFGKNVLMNFRLKIVKKTCLFSTLLLFSSIMMMSCDNGTSPDSIIADVAVYVGQGSWEKSVTASLAAVEFAGLTVDTIGAAGILNGKLVDYGSVLFPGGDARDFTSGLGSVGRMKLESYVASGGGFIGFGGGAVIADSATGLFPGVGLFEGKAEYPVESIFIPSGNTIASIQLIDDMHPVGRDGLSNYQTLYRDGPQFSITGQEVSVIYNYALTGTPAAVAFEYMHGRIFLAGFQPEFEENDARDSCDVGEELDDPDSEWDMIERAVKYCLWLL